MHTDVYYVNTVKMYTVYTKLFTPRPKYSSPLLLLSSENTVTTPYQFFVNRLSFYLSAIRPTAKARSRADN